jgi:hypothetical protein
LSSDSKETVMAARTKAISTADVRRCDEARGDPNIASHDTEWGVPVHDDR